MDFATSGGWAPMSPFKLSSFDPGDDQPLAGFDRQAAALPEDPFLSSGRENGRVLVLGHRGAPSPGRPENSVVAVTEALLQGADGVEVDVWLTDDGTLVCTHDLRDVTDVRELATLPELLAAVQLAAGAQVIVEAKPVADAA